jgi:hypothetical protein
LVWVGGVWVEWVLPVACGGWQSVAIELAMPGMGLGCGPWLAGRVSAGWWGPVARMRGEAPDMKVTPDMSVTADVKVVPDRMVAPDVEVLPRVSGHGVRTAPGPVAQVSAPAVPVPVASVSAQASAGLVASASASSVSAEVPVPVGLDVVGRGRMRGGVGALVEECVRREDRFGPHVLVEEFGEVVEREVYRRLGVLLGLPAEGVVLVGDVDAAFSVLVGRF